LRRLITPPINEPKKDAKFIIIATYFNFKPCGRALLI